MKMIEIHSQVTKKYEETSHEYEEVFIENTEDNFETHATLEMK